MRKIGLAAIALALTCANAQAHDLGVVGDAMPVAEPNLVEYFIERAAKVDWEAKAQTLAKETDYKLKHLPDLGFEQATKTETTWIDPSLVLSSDITAPVKQADGQYKWVVMYRKGDVVNPLRYLRPSTLMLIFNPNDKAQKAFALAAKRAYPNNLMLLITGGNVIDLSKEIGQPVFYTTPAIVDKFKLKTVPALAGTGAGVHGDYLAITTFSSKDIADPDHAGALIQRDWFGIEPGVMAKKEHSK